MLNSIILGKIMAREIRIRINFDLCQACQVCSAVKACKVRAIIQPDRGEPPYLDIERCRDCNVCIEACPFGAIELLGRTQGQ
jgi:Fe-S-cluster-containing hydrogenase component 2